LGTLMHIAVLILSLTLQFINVVLALRLISLTGRRSAWLILAIALGLMASRRMSSLYEVLTDSTYIAANTSAGTEVLAITISILLLVALLQIQPLFLGMVGTERAVRESEAQYRSLIEFSPLAVIVCRGGKVALANLVARAIFGVDKEAGLTNRPFAELFDPAQTDQINETMRLVEEGVAPQPTIETQARRADAVRVDLELSITKFVFAGELAIYAVLQDVSARRRHEEALREREAELAHINRLHTLGEITAELAHEINQPLYAISNFAQAANLHLNSHDYKRRAEVERCLVQIATQAERAAQIVRKLRGYMSKSAGEPQVVSINSLARDAITLVGAEARKFGARTELALDAGDPPVQVDPIAIQQVLVNLLCNAFEAMSDIPKPERVVTMATKTDNGNVEVTIADHGPGIPEEQLSRVFEPYFTTKSHGMGMGLAVCRTIVVSHGGKIWAEHNAPKGAKFGLSLPKASTVPVV
jgi:PAS domain S-box-containing protein